MSPDYQPPTEVIKRVGIYLKVTMPGGPGPRKLITHLQGLEATQYRLAEAVVDWHKLLNEKKSQMLYPKDKDYSEMDRKIMLNASVAIIKRDYEFLVKLQELVRDRIDFGKSLLTML